MMRTLWRLAALGGMLAAATVPAFADGTCGDMPVTGQKVEWVGRDMVINGTPTQAALISFNLTSEQVADAFTQYWQQRGVATHRMHDKTMLLVSALSAQCSYTMELPLNQSAPVRGLYSVMQLGDAKTLPRTLRPSNYPLPAGQILLDMTSSDAGTTARTVQMSLPQASAQQASADYAARLKRDGWHTISGGPAVGRPNSAPFGYALAMQKDAYRLDAAFTPARGSTSVVINVSYQ
jgi:hypothetical protein